jgi:hypothetical protein
MNERYWLYGQYLSGLLPRKVLKFERLFSGRNFHKSNCRQANYLIYANRYKRIS